MIEELVDDRVIWHTEFSDEFHIAVHSLWSKNKKWKKNRRKLEARVWPR